MKAIELDPTDEAVVRALEAAFAGITHDLWVEEGFNVAPTRLEEAQRIRAKGIDNLTPAEIDYVMFKSITTMGGVGTFKYLLPRFLRAVLSGFLDAGAVDTRVLLGKLEIAEFASWPAQQRKATASALRHLAERLILLDLDEPGEGDEWTLREWAQAELARAV